MPQSPIKNDSLPKCSPKPEGSRLRELDGLRGLACLAVLACHLPRGFWLGKTGVDLFFVLSGFLITRIILQKRDRADFLPQFVWRRSLRIFPPYFLLLFLAYTINAVRQHPEPTTTFPLHLVYLQNVPGYWGGDVPIENLSLGHTWTLAIEEQFYLLWPILLIWISKRSTFLVSGLLVILPVILRYYGLPRNLLFGHTDGLAWGALLACAATSIWADKIMSHAWIFATIAFASFTAYGSLYWALSSQQPELTGVQFLAMNTSISLISLTYFGIIGFFVCKAGSRILSPFRSRWLVYIGTISYGLYVYHWLLYENLDTIIKFRWQMGDPWWLDVIKVTLSFVAAALSWHFLEKPLQNFKNAMWPDPQNAR